MRPELVVLGTSAGGLSALREVLGALPRSFPLPILAVQHRSRESTEALADVIGAKISLPVRDAEDGEPLVGPGVLLAPADYHMFVEPGRVALSTDEPVCFSRPSIDVLFESAADAYGAGVIAVLLTGANSDGARGLACVKRVSGFAIAQDPHTAENPEMPSAGIAAAPVDRVLPLSEIAAELSVRARAGDAWLATAGAPSASEGGRVLR